MGALHTPPEHKLEQQSELSTHELVLDTQDTHCDNEQRLEQQEAPVEHDVPTAEQPPDKLPPPKLVNVILGVPVPVSDPSSVLPPAVIDESVTVPLSAQEPPEAL